ncbi:MAG: YfcE family phosphodiesterase [Lactobacillales bacterium]|nr:YfcE family phosphodiesterase [Lactobacillales bacterium]
MSEILVISDSHGDRSIVEEVRDRYKGKVDFLFHNGDSEISPGDPLWKDFYVVGGNVDFSGFSDEHLVNVGKEVAFQTHGHLFGVKFDMNHLWLAAYERGASISLFGHTHQIYCEQHKGILFLNPGSISYFRGHIREKTYALLDFQDKITKVQYYNRSHEPLKELQFEFQRRGATNE